MRHRERTGTGRIGWLRAAVLGANDGIVSTASLVVGVAAADATGHQILVAGVAVTGRGRHVDGRPASTSRSAPRPTPNGPTSSASARSSPQTGSRSNRELAAIYVHRGLDRRSHSRSPTSSWLATLSVPTLGTKLGISRILSARAGAGGARLRRARSRWRGQCPCSRPSWLPGCISSLSSPGPPRVPRPPGRRGCGRRGANATAGAVACRVLGRPSPWRLTAGRGDVVRERFV